MAFTPLACPPLLGPGAVLKARPLLLRSLWCSFEGICVTLSGASGIGHRASGIAEEPFACPAAVVMTRPERQSSFNPSRMRRRLYWPPSRAQVLMASAAALETDPIQGQDSKWLQGPTERDDPAGNPSPPGCGGCRPAGKACPGYCHRWARFCLRDGLRRCLGRCLRDRRCPLSLSLLPTPRVVDSLPKGHHDAFPQTINNAGT
ncbi:hypothetical protein CAUPRSCDRAFT_11826 [Caulochytrium protostelioides]|uniref:Uncharacterized protein n=1 Tax=Caulochytrium protostelioides TaxID=1555241 RepID=A0A4P9WYA0_9FUNG|nr:hypothetical protein CAUPRSCDRAFT_11826 [Caulochytrium protostelioides]